MNDKTCTTTCCYLLYKICHKLITVKVINTDTMFDRHWDIDCCLHMLDQICNGIGLCH